LKSRRFGFLTAAAVALAIVAALMAFTRTEAFAQIRATLTKNVDEPGRTPWETRSQFLPNAGGCYGASDCFNYQEGTSWASFDLRPVPAGKRWIVQSIAGGMGNGNGRTNVILLGTARSSMVFEGMKWIYSGPFTAAPYFNSALFSANIYATFGPGDTPTLRVDANGTLSGYSVFVISGYLIDATN